MSISIRIPTPLRGLTNGQKTVEVEGKTVSEVLSDLDAKYPGVREMLYDKETLRPLFNLYLNDEDIRVLDKDEGRYEIDMNNPVKDGDQISIIPPIAGGNGRQWKYVR
jgi:molybdopterin synthase sulfur carrier subunit